jgi:predicted RNA-binding Zn-ribbon protein involved in translation (DUF1610 family)
MISIDLLCNTCSTRAIATLPTEEATYEARWECPDCGQKELKRVPSAPNLMKAAYPDGYKSKHSQDLREASQLEIAMSDLPQDKRAGIVKEIRKLKELKK